ncbi:hypothetical protein [Halomonas sp. AOP35-4E-18]|uniref:hypothetical protein n=1 Tax=Halomonas sp. AOP35-4E-18 TaxID=3457686 RepID=UPI004033636D
MDAGDYARSIGGEALRKSLRIPGPDGRPPHRFTKLVLDRWVLDEPNRMRLMCADATRLGWLLEAAQEQGDVEMELLTSVSAQWRREGGEIDTDILAGAGIAMGMPDSLPYRDMDKI